MSRSQISRQKGETPWHSGDADTIQALYTPETEEPPISQIEAPEPDTVVLDAAPAEPDVVPPEAAISEPDIAGEMEEPPAAVEIAVPDLDAQIAALQGAPEPRPSDLRVDDLDAQIEALRREFEFGAMPSPFAGADLGWLNTEALVEPPTVVRPPDSKPSTEKKPAASVPPSKVTLRDQPETQPITPLPADAVAKPEDWEDDISPELAAVLFAGQSRPAGRPTLGRPETAEATSVEIPAAGPQVITAPSEPTHLTERSHAQVKPLMAKELYSPAPDAVLTGKVRSVRIEEPLPDDEGDRIAETRDYLRPNLPGLDGRLVKRVKSEEVQFADGSWRWTFERLYSDGGSDQREVRANRDNTFITRKDEIDKPDIATHKRVKRRDEEAMIYAPPPPEEKHGLLGGLFGKKEEAPAGPISWRAATPAEIKAARKTGGQAF